MGMVAGTRITAIVWLLTACVDEMPEELEPLEVHKVVLMEIPVSPARAQLSVASPCFEKLATFDGLYDCSVTEERRDTGGPHRILPPCDGATGDCFRIVRDELNCLEGSHEKLDIVRTTQIAYDYTLVVQCVSQ